MISPTWQRAMLAVWTVALAACASPGAPGASSGTPLAATPSAASSPTVTESPTPTLAPTPLPATASPAAATPAQPIPLGPTPTLAATVSAVRPAAVHVTVLAENLPGPDDLALGSDGSIYMSDVVDGTVRRRTPAGQWQVVVSGLNEPEGMVILPGGALIIAEQGRNRLVRYDPADQSVRPFLNLKNDTRQAGVDGITIDARGSAAGSIIVPDGPNGTLLRVSLDGQAASVIARGLARPTSAWVEADGSLLVTDENGNALIRVHPDGTVEQLATLAIPDDVVEDSTGNIFVSTIGDGAVHLIAAGTREDSILVKGLSSPQGLLLEADGNLLVTDPGHHRLVEITLH